MELHRSNQLLRCFAVTFESAKRKETQRVVKFPLDRRRATAGVAARNLELQGPVDCCGFGSFYEMWTKIKDYPMELSLGSNTARPEYFAMYHLIVAWLSVVLAHERVYSGPVFAQRPQPRGFEASRPRVPFQPFLLSFSCGRRVSGARSC